VTTWGGYIIKRVSLKILLVTSYEQENGNQIYIKEDITYNYYQLKLEQIKSFKLQLP